MKQILAVAIGGAMGATCRHLVDLFCSRYHFALGTLTVNIVGCFMIGLLVTLRSSSGPQWDDLTHSALTIGFIGALTTFSTFGLHTTQLFHTAQHGLGLLNIASNMLFGLAAIYVGVGVGRWMN